METLEARNRDFNTQIWRRLQELCRQPEHMYASASSKAQISDQDIVEIAQCLSDLGEDDASERPRTYAILHMMDKRHLLQSFVTTGLRDNSLPYPDRRSFPPTMRKFDADACHQFLELQAHVMSPILELERLGENPHVSIESKSIDQFLRRLGKLGKGGEARVDKVKSSVTGNVYARKLMYRSKDFNKDKRIFEKFINEVQILKKLDHEHLVKIIGSYSDEKHLGILMTPVAERDLKQYLRSCNNTLNGLERSRLRMHYGCLANAVAYLHQHNIRHKDIKPNNILLKGEDIYITDFGTAIEFEGDKSVTKETVKAKTSQYQSPEVARGNPRGTASDIWSLGVTFLEMTTILRSETLDSMQRFLKHHGSKEVYVFENLQGAMQWIEYLSKNIELDRTDNAPMQWIRDMLEEKSKDRPTADQLCQNIAQATNGGFCCNKCRGDDSTASESSTDDENGDGDDYSNEYDDDDIIRPRLAQPSSSVSAENPRPFLVKSILEKRRTKQERRPPINPDTIKRSSRPETSPLQRLISSGLFGYLHSLSLRSLQFRPKRPPILKEDPISVRRQSAVSTSQAYQHDPYACHVPGSFPELDSSHSEAPLFTNAELGGRDVQGRPESLQGIDDQPWFALKESSFSCVLKGPIAFTLPLQPEVEWNMEPQFLQMVRIAENIDQVVDNSVITWEVCTIPEEIHAKPESHGYKSIETSFEDQDCLFDPGPRGFIVKIPGAMRKTFQFLQGFHEQPNNTRLQRSRSDENIEIQRQTKSILENVGFETGDLFPTLLARRSSHSMCQKSMEGLPKTVVFAELHAFKQKLQDTQILSGPVKIEEEGIFVEEETASTNKDLKIPFEEFVPEPSHIPEAPEPTASDNPIKNDGTFQKSSNHQKKKSITTISLRKNPLAAFFESVRGQSTAAKAFDKGRLIEENPGRLLRMPHPTFKVERADSYMQIVFDDAASSVATSIMSTRTRETFKLAGLMLPLQDRTNNYLGEYTKLGKVDAVRMLLREGCCPGTAKHTRTGPIFNVVRGRSLRHLKCLRALIEHGVDVNVWQNGKTPLLEAIEHNAWPGYITVIYLLLSAGANPNAKDNYGDPPVLKLLGGGFQPLEDHRRKALALLLWPSWKTKVNVTQLGTQNKPLHLAIRRNDPYVLSMLLKKDDSVVNAEFSEGLNPILLAARSWTTNMSSDQLEILDILLEKNADPNVKMLETHETPLHIATSYGLVDAVERLLVCGAEPMNKTKDGESAFDLANDRTMIHACGGCADCTVLMALLES